MARKGYFWRILLCLFHQAAFRFKVHERVRLPIFYFHTFDHSSRKCVSQQVRICIAQPGSSTPFQQYARNGVGVDAFAHDERNTGFAPSALHCHLHSYGLRSLSAPPWQTSPAGRCVAWSPCRKSGLDVAPIGPTRMSVQILDCVGVARIHS